MLMGKGMFLNSLSTFNRQKKFTWKMQKKKSDHAVFQWEILVNLKKKNIVNSKKYSYFC